MDDAISISGYNPVPYFRKMAGDYFYILFKSPEDTDYHITAYSEGFFVNQSTNSHYSYKPSNKHTKVYTSLFNLICSLSPKLKEDLKKYILKKRQNDYQKWATGPFPAIRKPSWMIDSNQNTIFSLNTWKVNPYER
jgi:hypothetical protein